MMIPIIDLHQDLLIAERAGDSSTGSQTGFEELSESNVRIVLATGFADVYDPYDASANALLEKDLNFYASYCREHKEWNLIKNALDLKRVIESGIERGIIPHIEGLNIMPDEDATFATLDRWFEKGLRSIGMLWIVNNAFGGGTNDSEKGLSVLGRELIKWCESKGVIVDLAHMNEPTFWDARKEITKPPLVSHTAARALVDKPRNLSDKQLRSVAEQGGVAGLFFSSAYVAPDAEPFTINDIVRQLRYMIDTAGIDHVALGTDYGGVTSSVPHDMPSALQLEKLCAALEHGGLNTEQIEKILYRNALRVLTAHLQA